MAHYLYIYNLPFYSNKLHAFNLPFAANKYHISYKKVAAGNNDHLLDRISEEVDLALNQYPGTWAPTNALIITWKVEPRISYMIMVSTAKPLNPTVWIVFAWYWTQSFRTAKTRLCRLIWIFAVRTSFCRFFSALAQVLNKVILTLMWNHFVRITHLHMYYIFHEIVLIA